ARQSRRTSEPVWKASKLPGFLLPYPLRCIRRNTRAHPHPSASPDQASFLSHALPGCCHPGIVCRTGGCRLEHHQDPIPYGRLFLPCRCCIPVLSLPQTDPAISDGTESRHKCGACILLLSFCHPQRGFSKYLSSSYPPL